MESELDRIGPLATVGGDLQGEARSCTDRAAALSRHQSLFPLGPQQCSCPSLTCCLHVLFFVSFCVDGDRGGYPSSTLVISPRFAVEFSPEHSGILRHGRISNNDPSASGSGVSINLLRGHGDLGHGHHKEQVNWPTPQNQPIALFSGQVLHNINSK